MGDCEELAADLHGLEKCFVVLEKDWDADERRFTGFRIPHPTPVI